MSKILSYFGQNESQFFKLFGMSSINLHPLKIIVEIMVIFGFLVHYFSELQDATRWKLCFFIIHDIIVFIFFAVKHHAIPQNLSNLASEIYFWFLFYSIMTLKAKFMMTTTHGHNEIFKVSFYTIFMLCPNSFWEQHLCCFNNI